MSEPGGGPLVEIANLQSRVPLDMAGLRVLVAKALPLCVARVAGCDAPLPGLRQVEIAVISDEEIARVHGEFLGDPTPTDVITFDHGEILVSADTAEARAPEFGNAVEREVALYVIHGLLHLAGFADKTRAEFERMRKAQSSVLAAVWPGDG